MNLTLKHNGHELINTDRIVKQSNSLIAYNGENVVKVTFSRLGKKGESISLLIDCRRMEGGELMNELEKDKYGVIENEDVLTDAEKEELEKELHSGNDAEHV